MKHIINVYGENYDQVVTVATRLSTLSTIDIVDSCIDVDHYGIISSITKKNKLFPDEIFYYHFVNANDMIDDDYIVSIIVKAVNTFFIPKDEEDV
jgi:hypothetical protein